MSLFSWLSSLFQIKPSMEPIPSTRLVSPNLFALSQKGEELILEQEGLDQPGNFVGGNSGVTIGIGYDLGTVSLSEFTEDWKNMLPRSDFCRLAETIGFSGSRAKEACQHLGDIKISRMAAVTVFNTSTVPHFWKETLLAFPGAQLLPSDVQGALLSLVYNRGAAMQGDRRKEMRDIRDAVARLSNPVDPAVLKEVLQSIVAALKSMTRLWPSTSGVYKHRLAEAALVQSALDL